MNQLRMNSFLKDGNMEKRITVPTVRNRTFQFNSESVLRKKTKDTEQLTLSICSKSGRVTFSKDCINYFQFDKCRIKFFVDTGNRILAFRKTTEFGSLKEIKEWKKVTMFKHGSGGIVCAERAIAELNRNNATASVSYKKLPIKKWSPKDLLSEEYYFVDLKEYERKHDREATDGANA